MRQQAQCLFYVNLILAFIKFNSKLNRSLQQLFRLLQLNLFMRRDLLGLLGVIHQHALIKIIDN